MPETRKVTVILVADIVGFSGLLAPTKSGRLGD